RLFETLLAVQGVGPKVAVAILSGLPVAELVRAVASGDVARLTQVRGIGRKTAERLVLELRDRIAAAVGASARGPAAAALAGAAPRAGAAAPPGRLGEVHAALLALGYKPNEFEAVLPKLDPTQPVAELVKHALAALRRR